MAAVTSNDEFQTLVDELYTHGNEYGRAALAHEQAESAAREGWAQRFRGKSYADLDEATQWDVEGRVRSASRLPAGERTAFSLENLGPELHAQIQAVKETRGPVDALHPAYFQSKRNLSDHLGLEFEAMVDLEKPHDINSRMLILDDDIILDHAGNLPPRNYITFSKDELTPEKVRSVLQQAEADGKCFADRSVPFWKGVPELPAAARTNGRAAAAAEEFVNLADIELPAAANGAKTAASTAETLEEGAGRVAKSAEGFVARLWKHPAGKIGTIGAGVAAAAGLGYWALKARGEEKKEQETTPDFQR